MNVILKACVLLLLIKSLQGMPQLPRDWDHPSRVEVDAIEDSHVSKIPVFDTYEVDKHMRKHQFDRKALHHILKQLGARRLHERRQKGDDKADADDDELVYDLDDVKTGLLFDFSDGIIGSKK